MILWIALCVAVLTYAAVLLILRSRLLDVILGFGLIAHVGNLIVLSSGGVGDQPPVVDGPLSGEAAQAIADPLPQALVLTAIVISMALSIYMVALRQRTLMAAEGHEGQEGQEGQEGHVEEVGDEAVENSESGEINLKAAGGK